MAKKTLKEEKIQNTVLYYISDGIFLHKKLIKITERIETAKNIVETSYLKQL